MLDGILDSELGGDVAPVWGRAGSTSFREGLHCGDVVEIGVPLMSRESRWRDVREETSGVWSGGSEIREAALWVSSKTASQPSSSWWYFPDTQGMTIFTALTTSKSDMDMSEDDNDDITLGDVRMLTGVVSFFLGRLGGRPGRLVPVDIRHMS